MICKEWAAIGAGWESFFAVESEVMQWREGSMKLMIVMEDDESDLG